MEIRRILTGGTAKPAPARPAKKAEQKPAARPSADRLELSRQWVEGMEEQRAQVESALLAGRNKKKQSSGILDMLDGSSAESAELDAEAEAFKIQQKCLEIAMRIMQGKRVPPEDERYLMEHDPEGYKLAVVARQISEPDDEECESVLDEEDKNPGEKTTSADESAPPEVSSGGEGAAPSSGGSEE